MRRFASFLLLALVAAPPLAHAQSQAMNGAIEGVVRDTTGDACPARPSRSRTWRRERSASVHERERRQLSRAPAAARLVHGEGRAHRLQDRRADGRQPVRRPDRGGRHDAGGRRRIRGRVGDGRLARRPAGQDRPRAHDLAGRDQEPAPGVAQPLQLRLPAGERHRVREQRVRGAPHQRQRQPDAHELPDRRKHQHPEGPRRPAHAADLRGGGAGGQGHHVGLRSRVRPDHGHGLQRGDPVGHQRHARLPDLPLPARGDERAAVLPVSRARARPTTTSTTSPPPWAGRSSRTGGTTTSATSTWTRTCATRPRSSSRARSTTPGPRPVLDRDPRGRRHPHRSSTSTSRSPRPTTRSPPSTSSPRATSSSRTSPPTTSGAASTPSSAPPTSTTGWTRRRSS